MHPFKMFDVKLDALWIDNRLVMLRPDYMSIGQWFDYWDAVLKLDEGTE